MTHPELLNAMVFLGASLFAVVAQTDTTSLIGSSFVQFGAIGIVLAWLTLVDIPNRNKAVEKREEAAEKREAALKSILEAQQNAARADLARVAADQAQAAIRLADALTRFAQSSSEQTSTLDDLVNELRTERRTT